MSSVLIVAATDRELCGYDGLVCGVGPVEAATATARALALRPWDAVLHIGLAGGRDIPPGTIVVGTESVYCDLRAEWRVVDRATPDPTLLAEVRGALPEAVAAPIHTSAAVGGASNSLLQGPLVEAMEGFGVLRAAASAHVAAVEVRVISNEHLEADRTRWDVDGALEALGRAMPVLFEAVSRETTARGS